MSGVIERIEKMVEEWEDRLKLYQELGIPLLNEHRVGRNQTDIRKLLAVAKAAKKWRNGEGYDEELSDAVGALEDDR